MANHGKSYTKQGQIMYSPAKIDPSFFFIPHMKLILFWMMEVAEQNPDFIFKIREEV